MSDLFFYFILTFLIFTFLEISSFLATKNLTTFEKYELENSKAFSILQLIINYFIYLVIMFFFMSLVSELVISLGLYMGLATTNWIFFCGQFVAFIGISIMLYPSLAFNPLEEYEKKTQESFWWDF